MSPSSEQYAQIAALFTTEENVAQRTLVELLIPAHLPVQGGLWLVPYASREAGDSNSILVRMHEETIDIAAMGNSNIQIQSCNSLDSFMQKIEHPVQHWIVQPPEDADPTMLLHCDADRITLLSGADQAAVVGAYRLLKGFVTAATNKDAIPPIRIVIVGAEERAAADAANRIMQTAKHQLGVQIDIGQPLPAMGSQPKVLSQGSLPRLCNIVDLLTRIRTSTQGGSDVADVFDATERFENQEISSVPAEELLEDKAEKMSVEHDEKPIDETSDLGDTLVSYVSDLLSISLRCPGHDEIELAIDTNGCVHILAHVDDMRKASIVSAWITNQWRLIQMACGGLNLNQSLPPIQHLFTDDASSVSDLQGTNIKLHLLTEVEIEGKCGPFSTPLN